MSDARGANRARVAVIGLGSMGYGMAGALSRAGHDVIGYDVARASVDRFVAEGGGGATDLPGAAAGADAVLSVVVNAQQTEAVLFGEGGLAAAMPEGAVFVSSATMDPAAARRLAARLEATGRYYLDAPISGGTARAATGDLTVMASGRPEAFAKARPVLDAIAAKVYELGDEAGIGASFKMINQLLVGVHIVAAGEAMAMAGKLGLDLQTVYDVITASAGNSWAFENRMTHVISGDYRPLSAVEIFVKDLGIVQDMARAERFPAVLSAAALQMFLAAAGSGLGREHDAAVAKVYAALAGVDLPGMAD
jgi:3-hydroxyisobutyrate dehydrogenase